MYSSTWLGLQLLFNKELILPSKLQQAYDFMQCNSLMPHQTWEIPNHKLLFTYFRERISLEDNKG